MSLHSWVKSDARALTARAVPYALIQHSNGQPAEKDDG